MRTRGERAVIALSGQTTAKNTANVTVGNSTCAS